MKMNSPIHVFHSFDVSVINIIFLCWIFLFSAISPLAAADNPNPPSSPVKLIFIHHSTGGNWLADANESSPYGELGKALMNNNYYVSATNYGWGPDSIGDRTDIVNWPEWFTGSNTTAIMSALYSETGQNFHEFGDWTRMTTDPGGPNQIVLFKSCFPNSNLTGNSTDSPYTEPNDWENSVANAKAIYNRLLTYFATRQDKLFIVITAPPLKESEYPENAQTPAARAANARAFNNWLINNWLTGYSHSNVAVFDYYNVLTSNGGSPNVNDVNTTTGNHHRWWNGAVQHVQSVNNNFPAYPSGDSHPSTAGHRKASAEFLPLLNVFYHRWQSGANNPVLTVSPTSKSVSNQAGTFSIEVSNTGTGTMPWTAAITSGGTWLSITSGTSGTNSGTITASYSTNPDNGSRTAVIRVSATDAIGSPKDITVIQSGAPIPTPTPTPVPTPTPTPTPVPTPTPTPLVQTRVFQHGVAGYTGGRDTIISRLEWDTPPQHTVNYGQHTGLLLSRDGGDNPLIGFDLSSIPSSSQIVSATLSLYNTTQSSLPRRIELFQVLRNWDEGNQIHSPINAAGKHGATGDYAFRWYPGEGTDVAWGARGMQSGTDYAAKATSSMNVVNPGWYSWDISSLVLKWVRSEQPNYGIVLRDATGYQDNQPDSRVFVSNQGSDTIYRPKLTVVYNSSPPFVLDVSPSIRNVAKEAGNTTFTVSNTGTGNMNWTALVASGNGWLSISSGSSGTNTGTITCVFSANSGTSARTGTIRMTAAGASGSPKDVAVTQAGGTASSAAQVLGVWSDGVWAWNKATGSWSRMASTAGASMIAAGKVDGDSTEDMIGVWASGLYVRLSSTGQWLRLSTSLPTWIAAGDMNNDGRDDVIGSWKNDGVYYRDSVSGKWWKITSSARQLAVGNFGGVRDDLAGVWNDGLWVRYSATASWQKIDANQPVWIASGDMNGDKRADIIGSYSTGTWYRNSATQSWNRITTPAEQVAAGDIDGDGRDDLIGIWSDGLYVRYGTSGLWQKTSSSKPQWIATGKILEAILAAGLSDHPDEEGMIDLSQEWDEFSL